MIAVSVYCYLIKYRAKQKHLLPFHANNGNNEMKEFLYWQYKLKMTKKMRDIVIESHTYYFFNDIINVTNFDPNKIKIDKKS